MEIPSAAFSDLFVTKSYLRPDLKSYLRPNLKSYLRPNLKRHLKHTQWRKVKRPGCFLCHQILTRVKQNLWTFIDPSGELHFGNCIWFTWCTTFSAVYNWHKYNTPNVMNLVHLLVQSLSSQIGHQTILLALLLTVCQKRRIRKSPKRNIFFSSSRLGYDPGARALSFNQIRARTIVLTFVTSTWFQNLFPTCQTVWFSASWVGGELGRSRAKDWPGGH